MSEFLGRRFTHFPAWVLLGGIILALGYLPSLATPFDFIDDGNLIYPAPPGTSLSTHADLWWDKVVANVEHLGPFRPTLWLHWEVFANLFQGDAFAWRVMRMVWCGLAATLFLWLLRELKITPVAALLTAGAAMWNPYRNEIWTSLTLAEGVAMPYALFALVAARKAAHANRGWTWDVACLAAWVICLGCKNVFVAMLPAMLVLRTLTDDVSLREAYRRNRWACLVYCLPVLLPLGHFVYFSLNRHAGQYETPGPSLAQLGRIVSWMKGAAGLDFLGLGLVLASVTVACQRSALNLARYRAALLAAVMLFVAGVVVYLPMPMMAMRYTMPAVWGVDLGIAVLLTGVLASPLSRLRFATLNAVVVGLGVTFCANLGRQQRFAARAEFLWQALKHIETTAEPNATLAWVSGDTSSGMLNAEEGIHFRWHLLNRGRGDITIALVDAQNQPIDRVELPPVTSAPALRLSMKAPTGTPFAAKYHLGRKQFRCTLESVTPPSALDPAAISLLKGLYEKTAPDIAENSGSISSKEQQEITKTP
jgi:hypothetical protein